MRKFLFFSFLLSIFSLNSFGRVIGSTKIDRPVKSILVGDELYVFYNSNGNDIDVLNLNNSNNYKGYCTKINLKTNVKSTTLFINNGLLADIVFFNNEFYFTYNIATSVSQNSFNESRLAKCNLQLNITHQRTNFSDLSNLLIYNNTIYVAAFPTVVSERRAAIVRYNLNLEVLNTLLTINRVENNIEKPLRYNQFEINNDKLHITYESNLQDDFTFYSTSYNPQNANANSNFAAMVDPFDGAITYLSNYRLNIPLDNIEPPSIINLVPTLNNTTGHTFRFIQSFYLINNVGYFIIDCYNYTGLVRATLVNNIWIANNIIKLNHTYINPNYNRINTYPVISKFINNKLYVSYLNSTQKSIEINEIDLVNFKIDNSFLYKGDIESNNEFDFIKDFTFNKGHNNFILTSLSNSFQGLNKNFNRFNANEDIWILETCNTVRPNFKRNGTLTDVLCKNNPKAITFSNFNPEYQYNWYLNGVLSSNKTNTFKLSSITNTTTLELEVLNGDCKIDKFNVLNEFILVDEAEPVVVNKNNISLCRNGNDKILISSINKQNFPAHTQESSLFLVYNNDTTLISRRLDTTSLNISYSNNEVIFEYFLSQGAGNPLTSRMKLIKKYPINSASIKFYLYDWTSAGYNNQPGTRGGAVCVNTPREININFNQPNIITLSPLPLLCGNTPNINLNNFVSHKRGKFTGQGMINDSIFVPSALNPGNYTINYKFTNQFGCLTDTNYVMNILTQIPVTLTIPTQTCINTESFELKSSVNAGSFTGKGVINGFFNPNTAGLGVHTITHTFTSQSGCTTITTHNITVRSITTPTINVLPTVCSSDNPFDLNNYVSPQGGTFSWSGTTGNMFNPTTGGAGTYPVSYSFTNQFGCVSTASKNITVNGATSLTIDAIAPTCQSAQPILLKANVSGGTWSGEHVFGGFLNPQNATSNTTVKYEYINNLGCKSERTATVQILPRPNVSLDFPNEICVNSNPIQLTGGIPLGGTYSGNGISNGVFNPANLTPGNNVVSYRVTDINNCSNTAIDTIIVRNLDNAVINELPTVCTSDNPFELNNFVTPVGGTFSWKGNTTNMFIPSSGGAGTYPVSYSFTNQFGCVSTTSRNITVNGATTLTIDPIAPTCQSAQPILLKANVSGGTWIGEHVFGDFLNPQNATTNTTVTYQYTNNLGCISNRSITVQILPKPVVNLNLNNKVCINESAFELVGGSPLGGTYLGNGVSNGLFNPQSFSTAGPKIVSYRFTDINNCFDIATDTVFVNPLPVITFQSIPNLCNNDAPVFLNVSPVGGTFTGQGVENGIFNPINLPEANYVINYSFTDNNGCENSVNRSTNIYRTTNITIDPIAPICNFSESIKLNASTNGGTWSGEGVFNDFFNPQSITTNNTVINYSYTNTNGCVTNRITTVQILPAPNVTFNSLSDVCLNDAPVLLSGGVPSGGIYSGVAVTNGIFTPNLTTPGAKILNYTFTDINGCSNTAQQGILIRSLPTINFDIPQAICKSANSIILNGIPTNNTINWSGLGVQNNLFNPNNVPSGLNDISYKYTDEFGCTNTLTKSIMVSVAAEPFTNVKDIYCKNEQISITASSSDLNPVYNWFKLINNQRQFITNGAILNTISDRDTFIIQTTNNVGCLSEPKNVILNISEPNVDFFIFNNKPEFLRGDIVGLTTTTHNMKSYFWDLGDGFTSIDKDALHFYNMVGEFDVSLTVTDNNGCTNSLIKKDFIKINSPINTNFVKAENSINVFPNPFRDIINFEINSILNEDITIKLFDTNGKLIDHFNESVTVGKNVFELNTLQYSLQNGMYYIQVFTSDSSQTFKLILTR